MTDYKLREIKDKIEIEPKELLGPLLNEVNLNIAQMVNIRSRLLELKDIIENEKSKK